MKLTLSLLVTAAGAALLSSSVAAQTAAEPSHTRIGLDKPMDYFIDIEVRNFHDEPLGRIRELGLDLVNGRVVDVLVECDSALKVDGKVVAVPPLALAADPLNTVYRLAISTEAFRALPAVHLSQWEDYGQTDRIAATYRAFGEDPYFLVEGETGQGPRPKVALGYVERSSKILDLPVGNSQGDSFGKVYSLTLDIPRGRIRSVIVLKFGNFKTKSVIPAMALSFNARRDGLILDDTKQEERDEPRYVLTDAVDGQRAFSQEEPYQGPHTLIALAQGTDYRDIDRTVHIRRDIRGAGQLEDRNIEVGTMNGRVTLRGWVSSVADKQRIDSIAVADSRLELVDDQITVGEPAHP